MAASATASFWALFGKQQHEARLGLAGHDQVDCLQAILQAIPAHIGLDNDLELVTLPFLGDDLCRC